MPTPETPNVVMVPVKRFDVNLSLQDIMTPLTQMAAKLTTVAPTNPAEIELHAHIKDLSDLAAKLNDIAGRIHAIDPSVLAPGANLPPKK
jgi:hypothetical protein